MMTPWVLRLIIAKVAVRADDAERWSTGRNWTGSSPN
jgi:hypothetical protein